MKKETPRFLKHRWHRITAIGLISAAAMILAVVIFLELFLPSFLAEKIKAGILKGSGSLYHVTFSSVEVHLFKGEIILHQVSLAPDSIAYHDKVRSGQAPEQLYILKIKTAVISHTHPFQFYFRRQLDIGDITLSDPALIVTFHPLDKKAAGPKTGKTVYGQISGSLHSAHVGQISLKGLNIKYEDFSNVKPAISELHRLDLKADDLLIDSATQFDKSRFLYCRNLTTDLHNYSGRTANSLYVYSVQLIRYSTFGHKLIAYHFALRSLHTPRDFFMRTYQDRFNFNADSVQLTGFNFELYQKDHTLRGTTLLLSKGNMDVYSNPRTDPKSFHMDKAATFPNKAIRMLPVFLRIDTINVRRFQVRYDEFNVKTKQKGHIFFEEINGHFFNVTNDPDALRKNSRCQVRLDALFLNRAKSHLDMQLNLNDSLYSYSYQGSVGPIDLQAVNMATVPLASLAIRSGTANGLDFSINGNRKTARGQVNFRYQNLKIQLLKADTQEQNMRRLPVASLLANALVIKPDNPDAPGDAPRAGFVRYLRPVNYAFFKTLWRTLLTGIKPCAGLGAKMPQDADVKAQQKIKKKIQKKERRALRKRRRAKRRQVRELKKEQKKGEGFNRQPAG